MTIRRFLIASSIFAACLVGASAVQAAVLYTLPEAQSVDPADTVTLDVRLNSENDTINAVQARILFDPTALEVVEVSKAGSFLVLWPEEPKVDVKAGVITFTGGTPNGSYVVNGRLVSIVFRSKHLGSTNVLFDTGTSGVYRNDGLGTKVALSAKPATIDVALTGRTLTINSTTHPNADTWYPSSFIKFDWNVMPDAQYAYLLSDNPTALPDTRFGASLREAMYTNLKDGAYMFVLQEKLPNDTWGTPVRRRALVDTKPPDAFTPQLTRDVVPGKLALVFAAHDATSAVVRYRAQEGDMVTESATSPYTLLDQTQHRQIIITAYDSAGNFTTATIAPSTSPVASRAFPVALVALGALMVLVAGAAIVIVRRRH